MKKILLAFLLMMGTITFLQSSAFADTTATIHLHDPTSSDVMSKHEVVYDLSSQIQTDTVSQLKQQLINFDSQDLQQYVSNLHLSQVADVSLNSDGNGDIAVNADEGKTYLIFQDNANLISFNKMIRSVPIIVSFPLVDSATDLDVYIKSVTEQSALYFYKYGKMLTGKTAPLAGASFALCRDISGIPHYLTVTGHWVASQQPLVDEQIRKITSDQTGLVSLTNVNLKAGTYYFTELKTAAGYRITDEAKRISVSVTNKGKQIVRVRGQTLKTLLAGQVQSSEARRTALRVYNLQDQSITATVPPDAHGKQLIPQGLLPETDEAKTGLTVLGLLLCCSAIWMWKHVGAKKESRKRL